MSETSFLQIRPEQDRQKWARHRGQRGRRRRRGDSYARGTGNGGRLYDSTLLGTARHMRCDRCLRDYLPQHMGRVAPFSWWCGNCRLEHGTGTMMCPRYMLRREQVTA